MLSKFLSGLSKEEDLSLRGKLHQIQNTKCYIRQDPIDLDLHTTNIDHIVPLAAKGTDSEEIFALTYEPCNKSEQDSNLKMAKMLHRLKRIQEDVQRGEGRSASLKDVLFTGKVIILPILPRN